MVPSSTQPRASLSTKIILICGLSFLLIQLVAVTLSGWLMKQQVEKNVYAEAISKSQILGEKIILALTEQNTVVRNIQSTIETAHKTGVLNKQFIVDLLVEDMKRFPAIYAMDFKEIPGGFDGTQVPGGPGTNSHGIFFPSVLRGPDNRVTVSTPPEHYSAVYWHIVKTGELDGLEPYIDHDTHVPMVSPTYPITFDGKRIGVVGADIPLGWLAPLLRSVQIADGSSIGLLSAQGAWIVTSDPTQAMKHFSDNAGNDLARALATRKITILRHAHGNDIDRILVPLKMGNFNIYWTLVVEIPRAAITTPIWHTIYMLVVPGIALIALSLVVMVLVFRRLLDAPLRGLQNSVSALEEGQYEVAVFGTRRHDEIGSVARGLDSFRGALLKARKVDEAVAADHIRHEAEQERRHVEDEQRLADVKNVIDTIGNALTALSNGDLSAKIDKKLPREFDLLREDFNRSVERLAATISGISVVADTISEGSRSLATGAEDLAKRTEQQAAAIEQTTAAISQITHKAAHSETVLTSAQATGEQACQSAGSSSEIMRRTREAMKQIEDSSSQVAAIVQVIENIAFQTNVLALNASIEAARAGDSGKGFAVVANEVRTLAQRCTEAAGSISELVGKTVEEIRAGAVCVRDTEKALETITTLVTAMGEKLDTIVHNAFEQAASLREVGTAIAVMDQSTQKSASIADETRSSSIVLSDEVGSMGELVSRFSLPRETARRAEMAY
ncbi:methyl-accepting chemotaxis protein [Asaia sp. BMEF1]|uniref:methyl-accepting chemotaxis protein n=1 Tax=Asaia sp. BMEF1 TaxID=3155932 RepID=UPI003F66D116